MKLFQNMNLNLHDDVCYFAQDENKNQKIVKRTSEGLFELNYDNWIEFNPTLEELLIFEFTIVNDCLWKNHIKE